MKTHWDKRIAPIDRAVGPLEWCSVRGQMRKAAVRKRRGLPSRNVPAAAAFEMLEAKRANRLGELPDARRAERLQWLLLRERLLERKRAERRTARRRTRPSVNDTKINLWRRRQDWLRIAEAG
jgi:hypothetical protein